MATLNATRVAHGTLTANTVDVVTLTGGAQANVEVLNRSATADIYFRTDGTVPTVGGTDCDIVPAGGAVKLSVPVATATVIKLISSAAAAYSTTGC